MATPAAVYGVPGTGAASGSLSAELGVSRRAALKGLWRGGAVPGIIPDRVYDAPIPSTLCALRRHRVERCENEITNGDARVSSIPGYEKQVVLCDVMLQSAVAHQRPLGLILDDVNRKLGFRRL